MRIVLTAMLVILLAACSKLDREHYQQLKMGMSYEEVSALLGKADRCDDLLGTASCIWGDEQKNITVAFVGGKAVLFGAVGIN